MIRCRPDARRPLALQIHTLPCPWLPSAALQGQSLGTGRCTACKRVRRARVMPIWPCPPAPPRVLSLAAQGGREGTSPSWVGLTLPRAPRPGAGARVGVPSGPCAWNRTLAWLPPAPSCTHLHPPPLPAALPHHSPDSGTPGAGSAWGEPTQDSRQDSRPCSEQTLHAHGLHLSFLGAPASGPLSPLPSRLHGQL